MSFVSTGLVQLFLHYPPVDCVLCLALMFATWISPEIHQAQREESDWPKKMCSLGELPNENEVKVQNFECLAACVSMCVHNAHTYTHTHTHTHTSFNLQTHIHTHTHTCTHTYIHTHTHTPTTVTLLILCSAPWQCVRQQTSATHNAWLALCNTHAHTLTHTYTL